MRGEKNGPYLAHFRSVRSLRKAALEEEEEVGGGSFALLEDSRIFGKSADGTTSETHDGASIMAEIINKRLPGPYLDAGEPISLASTNFLILHQGKALGLQSATRRPLAREQGERGASTRERGLTGDAVMLATL